MASKRRLRRRSCERKVAHQTQAAAADALHAMIRSGHSGMGVYRCQHCRLWHIGHNPARVQQSIAQRRRNRDANA